jgi:WD40 repeat protein
VRRIEPIRIYALLSVVWLLSCGLLSNAAAQGENASQLPLQTGHTNAILEVRWSPNDKLILTYSAADGFLNVWRMPEGKLITTIEDSAVKVRGDDKRALRAFAWSDDDRLIATGSENGTAQVWEAETGKLLWSTRIADEYVTGVGFSHGGKYFAAVAAPEDKKHKLVLLNGANGQLIKNLGEIESRFLTYYHDSKLVFSDDDKQLSVGDISGIITQWDLPSGSLLSKKTLNLCSAERRMPNSFAYSEDLSLIVARCGLQSEVIETNTGSILRKQSVSVDFTSSIVLSRDKQFMAVGDSGVFKLLNLATGAEVTIDSGLPITCGCDFSKDNSLLALQDYFDGETVKVINLDGKQTVTRLEAHPGKVKALAFSADGRLLASGSEDRIVRVWDAQTGSLLQSLAGHTGRVGVVVFTPDGKLLVSASDDQTLKAWDVGTGTLVRSIQVTTEGINGLSSIAFSPDGKRMVTTLGAAVGLWDVSDWRLVETFTTTESHTSGEMTMCCGSTALTARFDATGKMIISAHEDGTIKVWDPQQRSLIPSPQGNLIRTLSTNERNESFALSPDETVLVANGGSDAPKLWQWASGKPLRSLGDEASYVHNVAFSPDSRIIATSDIGGTILLWNVSSGKLLREFDGGYSSDDALAFGPDGTRLASGGDNQNIIMWDVKSGKRLWHILPIRERHRPTGEEIADQKHAAALKAADERRAEQDTQRLKNRVFITFSHFGEPTNPGETRFAETGRPNKSLSQQSDILATGIWLRLLNASRLPINLSTESIYLPTKKKCGYQTGQGKFFYGLCESAEIGIRFSVLDTNGKPLRYGFDFGGISMVPPNTSVVFSVPRELLREGRSIVVSYKFLNVNSKGKLEEYGKEREITFSEANLTTQTPRTKPTKRKSTRTVIR